MPSTFLPRPVAALAAAAAIAVPVAGCGGGSSSAGADPGADPAAALPASAPVYLEAQVRPNGQLRSNVQAVGRKLLGGRDPERELVRVLDQQLHADGASFKRDVEPWLGDRVGLAVVSFGSHGSNGDGVAALTSKDDDRARAYLEREKGATDRQYRGVSYRLKAKDDEAAAVLDGRVLVGSEQGVKTAIDATKGRSLADVETFKQAREAVAPDGLGFVYLDPRRTLDGVSLAGSSARDAQGAQALKGLLAASGLRAVAASVDVHRDAIVADAALLGLDAKAGAGDSAGAAAAVPAGAWLSAGIGDVGGTVQRSLSQWSRSGLGAGGGIDPQALLGQLKAALGIDVQRDFLSWMGDAALFVEGTTPAHLGGALVIHSKDPAASRRAVGELRSLLPRFGSTPRDVPGLPSGATGLRLATSGVPGGVVIAAKGDRFVVAVGHTALADALGSGPQLSSTGAYRTASGLLGGAKPSFFLDTPKAVALLEARAGGDAHLRQAKPTLDALGPAAAGGVTEDGTRHVKLAIAVP